MAKKSNKQKVAKKGITVGVTQAIIDDAMAAKKENDAIKKEIALAMEQAIAEKIKKKNPKGKTDEDSLKTMGQKFLDDLMKPVIQNTDAFWESSDSGNATSTATTDNFAYYTPIVYKSNWESGWTKYKADPGASIKKKAKPKKSEPKTVADYEVDLTKALNIFRGNNTTAPGIYEPPAEFDVATVFNFLAAKDINDMADDVHFFEDELGVLVDAMIEGLPSENHQVVMLAPEDVIRLNSLGYSTKDLDIAQTDIDRETAPFQYSESIIVDDSLALEHVVDRRNGESYLIASHMADPARRIVIGFDKLRVMVDAFNRFKRKEEGFVDKKSLVLIDFVTTLAALYKQPCSCA